MICDPFPTSSHLPQGSLILFGKALLTAIEHTLRIYKKSLYFILHKKYLEFIFSENLLPNS
jgi:hypothetical protein